MGNLFNGGKELTQRYDLKGSLFGRTARKSGKVISSTVALKDLDFIDDELHIKLDQRHKLMFIKTLRADIQFLASHRIIDYSLLVGIHYIGGCTPLSLSQCRVYLAKQSLFSVEEAVEEAQGRIGSL